MATVLVVDDEPDIRHLVKVNLELDGHRVVVAENGARALEAVKAEVPDVMLLDLMMPELDGWGVLEAIKSEVDVDIRQIPVLMLTAYDTPENRIRGGIEGAIRYLTKPFSPDELRAEVANALEGEPEPVRRRRAQHEALTRLARSERGDDGAVQARGSSPHLTRLERAHQPAPEPAHVLAAREALGTLTDKQRELLERLARTRSVSDVAAELGVSRSNVYASLRRISRKLGIASVPELLDLVRRGGLLPPPAG